MGNTCCVPKKQAPAPTVLVGRSSSDAMRASPRVSPSPHTKYSPSFDSAAAEREYRQCLNAVSLDLMDRLCQLLGNDKAHFDRMIQSVVSEMERFVLDTVDLPQAQRQFAQSVPDDLDRILLLLKHGRQAPPRVDVPVERIIERITAVARSIDPLLLKWMQELRAADNRATHDALALIQRGFNVVFNGLSPTNPHILYGNIDRYTQAA